MKLFALFVVFCMFNENITDQIRYQQCRDKDPSGGYTSRSAVFFDKCIISSAEKTNWTQASSSCTEYSDGKLVVLDLPLEERKFQELVTQKWNITGKYDYFIVGKCVVGKYKPYWDIADNQCRSFLKHPKYYVCQYELEYVKKQETICAHYAPCKGKITKAGQEKLFCKCPKHQHCDPVFPFNLTMLRDEKVGYGKILGLLQYYLSYDEDTVEGGRGEITSTCTKHLFKKKLF